MFDRLPEKCLTCFSPFDRKNKEQVQSWFVVVKNKEQKVHLYCPDCWHKAQALMQKVVDDFKTRKEQNVSEESNV